MRQPPARSLAAFEAAARHGSFWRAAKELEITTSGVSHHIRALEEFLATPLFVRLNRGVRLTIEGAAFYESIHEAYQRIEDGMQRLRKRPQPQVLTVETGVSFGLRWLMPRLPLFMAEHPEIELQIVTPIRDHGLKPRPIDLHIQYGPVSQSGVRIEPLPEETVLPLCSPALLADGRTLNDPRDLSKFRLIESEVGHVTWSSRLAECGLSISDVSRLRFDNILLTFQAAVSGLGIALEGDLLASEELATGRLVVPPGLRGLAVRRSLRSLLIPEAQVSARKVQVFRDWLYRMFAS